MPSLGQEIFRAYDALGPVVVHQDGQRRILAFGNQVEQSCVSLADPARLEYVYTQAMFLAPLFVPRLRTALVLGLGGGSLVRALHEYAPGCRVLAVEGRALIARVARELFFLPEDARLEILVADAAEHMASSTRQHDLIFSDLYHAEGMEAQQVQQGFLDDCRRALRLGGLLVTNLWCSDMQGTREAAANLRAVFDQRVCLLHVQGGNIIAFAFACQIPVLDRKPFFAAAQALAAKLRIPLQRQARNLWLQNAEILNIGRYSRRMTGP
jgi:spermidine synthase